MLADDSVVLRANPSRREGSQEDCHHCDRSLSIACDVVDDEKWNDVGGEGSGDLKSHRNGKDVQNLEMKQQVSIPR